MQQKRVNFNKIKILLLLLFTQYIYNIIITVIIGLFKVENSEKVLIEIRDIKLTLEDKKNKIVEEVETVFSSLI